MTDITSATQNRTYEYYKSGDIHYIYDDADNVDYTYDYDPLHRLITETSGGVYGALTVNYNSIGNITSKTVGSNSLSYSYITTHKHAISAINGYNFAYDDNGNMTAGYDFTNPSSPTARSITWNADNMPSAITYGTSTSTLLYDGVGARAKKSVTSGGTTTTNYYTGDHYEVKKVGSTTTITKYIFAGNLRVAQIVGSTVSYFHKDHLGSSTVMTNSSGAVVESANFEPFGSMRAHTGTTTSNYKFTDQELDGGNGLYNYDARLYDPVIGRFISADTEVPDPYDPQSLNRYSYCENNPLIYTDPSGHALWGFYVDGVYQFEFWGTVMEIYPVTQTQATSDSNGVNLAKENELTNESSSASQKDPESRSMTSDESQTIKDTTKEALTIVKKNLPDVYDEAKKAGDSLDWKMVTDPKYGRCGETHRKKDDYVAFMGKDGWTGKGSCGCDKPPLATVFHEILEKTSKYSGNDSAIFWEEGLYIPGSYYHDYVMKHINDK